jgi:succinate-semialdehyde dehydrogenase/glutarate-semialdehyde dehydrogenase
VGNDVFVVDNPASAESLAVVEESGLDAADAALGAADAAAKAWSVTPSRTRSDVLRRGYELVLAHRDELVGLIVAEAGKRRADAHAEVSYGAEFLRWYSEQAVRLPGRFGPLPEGGATMYVDRRPVGPCLLLTPWNFPLAMVTRKVAPALAAGCTAVIKPSELTPLTCYRFVDLLTEAGLPGGVVNVVSTANPGPLVERLIRDPRLRKVSFTGSTTVGRMLMMQAAERMLRTSMELGGDAPLLVMSDADLDVAVEGTLAAKFRGSGQACTAANRILVSSSVADEYVSRLAARVEAIRAGAGNDPTSGVGPLISAMAVERTSQHVAAALSDGAHLVAEGPVADGPGYYFPATLIDGVRPDSAVSGLEWFAPVAAVSVFDDEEDMIDAAANSSMGLASYIFTRDIAKARGISAALEVGMTAINTGVLSNAAAPFGGVRLSGHGREGGLEGIEEYLEIHYRLEADGADWARIEWERCQR